MKYWRPIQSPDISMELLSRESGICYTALIFHNHLFSLVDAILRDTVVFYRLLKTSYKTERCRSQPQQYSESPVGRSLCMWRCWAYSPRRCFLFEVVVGQDTLCCDGWLVVGTSLTQRLAFPKGCVTLTGPSGRFYLSLRVHLRTVSFQELTIDLYAWFCSNLVWIKDELKTGFVPWTLYAWVIRVLFPVLAWWTALVRIKSESPLESKRVWGR